MLKPASDQLHLANNVAYWFDNLTYILMLKQ